MNVHSLKKAPSKRCVLGGSSSGGRFQGSEKGNGEGQCVRCSKGTFLSESIALTLVTARANSASIGDSNMFDYANDAVNT